MEAGVSPARPRHCNGQQESLSPLGNREGERRSSPKPGDLAVRATLQSLAGGMVASQRIEALPLAHLRSAGGG
jgi:hypothetical protein